MVNQGRVQEYTRDTGLPKYDSKEKFLTVVLNYGGSFSNDSSNQYLGGKKVAYDWCDANKLSFAYFNSFSENVGIIGHRRYHLRMRDNSFKLFVDDEDIRKWANSFLTEREMDVFIEMLDEDTDEEDSDFILGDEFTDEDDDLFDEAVDLDVEVEAADLDVEVEAVLEGQMNAGVEGQSENVIVEGQSENVVVEGQSENAVVDGQLEDDDFDLESYEDLDYSAGDDLSADDDDDDESLETEGIDVHENVGGLESMNIATEEKKAKVRDDLETDSDSGSEEDAVDVDELFDDGRISEDEATEQFLVFNPQTKFNPELVFKQVFSNKKEFKTAVESHAINARRNVKFTKNDHLRVYARCHSRECKWMINALKMKHDSAFQIRKIFDKHTCAPSNKVKSLTSTWLSERYLQRFKSDAGRSVKGFRADAMYDTRCEVSKTQAYTAKKKALAKLEGDPDAQYSKLWAYTDELRNTNPGSTVLLGTEVNNGVTRFREFYVCFQALKQGFMKYCRKILGVDGCFLKGKHGGMLLTAVGVDGNNNPFPVAYAVVEKENQDIWEWFLRILKTDLELKTDEITFMSDKQKGLIGAMESVFPGVDHRFCVRHLVNNMKVAGFRGVDQKNALCKAAWCTTVGQFNAAMQEMKKLSVGAWEWLVKKPPQQWSKAFFQEKVKCDMLLNNICESFNSNILEARDKSIITMLEWIRESVMVRQQKNRDRALAKWKGKLCPKIQKILERNMEKVNDCIPLKCKDFHYQVTLFDGGQYTVDLKQLTCSCRSWQLTGIPCTHSICAMLRQKMDPMDYVHECYHVETYNKTYEGAIFGISYDVLWGDSMFIPPLPPSFGQRARRGRRPLKRRVGPFEAGERKDKEKLQKMKKQCNPYKCKKCGETGHNSLSCGKATRKAVEKGKKKSVVQPPTDQGSSPAGAQGADPHVLAPPLPRRIEDCEIELEAEVPSTQQSQITSDNTSQPMVVGPSMHQQLQMSKKLKARS